MSESIFLTDGELFTPTEHARGPWDPRALHGGAPAALMAAAFERMEPGAVLPFDEYLFINADLTISLDRRPEGEWIALQAHTLLHPGGIGWAESVLHDERGPLGRATQALVVQRR
jgi:hypothetical protein